MSRKQYAAMLVLATVAGLVGGAVSNFLFIGTPVFAKKTPNQKEVIKEVIRAQKFDLVDQDGKLLAALKHVDGDPSLELYGQDGKLRAGLSLFGGEPILELGGRDGKLLAALRLIEGGPSLELYDQDEQPRVALGHVELKDTRTGSKETRPVSSLVLFDKDGEVIWKAP